MYLPAKRLSRSARVTYLRKALQKFSPDVIFAHSIIPSAYVRWAARSLGRPVVTVLHDATRDDYNSWVYRLAERVLPAPQYVVAVAAEALANYRKRFSEKMPGRVVENAINFDGLHQAQSGRGKFRAEVLRLNATEKLFVSIGRYSRQKNQELLIKAFAAIPEHIRAQSRLLLVGITEDRAYEQHLRDIAMDLGDRVLFLVDRPDSLQILACADVYCMPSLHEGFSLAFLEGLALGVKVLASNIPAFRFAATWDGVVLAPVEDLKLWCELMQATVIEVPTTYVRSLDKFNPATVASHYETIAQQLSRATERR